MAIKRFTNTNSVNSISQPGKVVATGGEIYDIAGFRIHIFKDYRATSTFNVTRGGTAEVLVVAGGGAGSIDHGGAGGGGGLLYSSAYTLSPGALSVTIGKGGRPLVGSYLSVYSYDLSNTRDTQGGVANRSYGNANSGDNTVFGTATALGGGGGSGFAATTVVTAAGGSGGGSGAQTLRVGGLPTQGNSGGIPGFGFQGGGNDGGADCGGGGGGAGSAGKNGSAAIAGSVAGDGGAGLDYSISGTSRGYAGGGGGGQHNSGNRGEASHGGGFGDGLTNLDGVAYGNATPGTGGGGGGRTNDGQRTGEGGSGIVIVRYAL
jgi:hypothetical protein